MVKKIKIVSMPGKYGRYIVVSASTGEILDDAQGYGYRSRQKAHAAWAYKHPTGEQSHNRKLNKLFMKQHKEFVNMWSDYLFDCLKNGEKPEYSDFKDMLAEEVPDFKGSVRSLYFYLQKH